MCPYFALNRITTSISLESRRIGTIRKSEGSQGPIPDETTLATGSLQFYFKLMDWNGTSDKVKGPKGHFRTIPTPAIGPPISCKTDISGARRVTRTVITSKFGSQRTVQNDTHPCHQGSQCRVKPLSPELDDGLERSQR